MFSNLLLQLIVLFLPTQLGWHFWPDFSRAAGVKVDFLSPTLYFVDLLLFLYVASNTSRIFKWLKKHLIPCFVFVLFVFFNVLLSVSPPNTFSWWLRLLIYLLFFLCLRLQKISWPQIKTPLVLSSLVVVVAQVLQLFYQSSINGLFYWLGERSYTFSTPGLARIQLFGQEFLRPPSLFSHPNSLAGYLLVVFYLLTVYKSPLWQKATFFFAVFLTISKGALLAMALVVLFKINPSVLIYSFLLFSFLQLALPSLWSSTSFILDRLFFITPARDLVLSKTFFGVGLGSFILAMADRLPGSFLLSSKLQPVHNLFLLALTELGLSGYALSSLLAYKHRRCLYNPKVLGLLALVCITGAFDHYWWTLPQNRLIFLLATAILL